MADRSNDPRLASARIADLPSDAVLGLHGPHRFLSNFHSARVGMHGVSFPAVEHALVAARIDPNGGVHDPEVAMRAIREVAQIATPWEAKRGGRTLSLEGRPLMRADWAMAKERHVLVLPCRQLAGPLLRDKLIATGEAPLYEVSTRGDLAWSVVAEGKGGDATLVGRNLPGQTLKQVRRELRDASSTVETSRARAPRRWLPGTGFHRRCATPHRGRGRGRSQDRDFSSVCL